MPVIAVDGPAASGKGTIARRLAAHFGYPWLDTGLLYRAVGVRVPDSDPEKAAKIAQEFDAGWLADENLRSGEAGVWPRRSRRFRRCARRFWRFRSASPRSNRGRCWTGGTSAP